MDMTETIQAKSDQINADDLIAGPRIVTVTEVRRGTAEQPVEIETAEFGPKRPFKPSKTVCRILVAAWGKEASAYTGRRMMLYRDPEVRFGGSAVGGIRVSALSDIDKPLSISLTVTRGKRAPYVVEPLKVPFPPVPEGIVAKIEAGGLSAQDQAKAIEWLDKAKECDPAEVARLRALVEMNGADR